MANPRPVKGAPGPGRAAGTSANGSGAPGFLSGLSDTNKAQIASALQLLFERLKPQHKPILNSLKEMGIKVRQRTIDGTECLCIPIDDLMRKEYLHMAGIDPSDFRESDD